MTLLRIKNLTQSFGGLTALSNINIEIGNNELIGLIGPNGAGKTTLFNIVTGLYDPCEGEVELTVNGAVRLIQGKKPHQITRLGVGRTFQNIRLFSRLSVIDNVKIAMHKNVRYGLLSAVLRLPTFYRTEESIERKAMALLSLMNMADKRDELATNLPYGDQRKLEIVRALATEPVLLFLDEPAAGMNPQETLELTRLIRRIKEEFKITIVLIEHDMSLVMNVCERIYVLDYGRLIASGSPEDIQRDRRVIKAYLGEENGC